jgi:lipopolysaccharide export system permease protein
MADRYDVLSSRIGGDVNRLSVSGEGIWLRQGGHDSQTVIHADSASATATELFGVTFYEYARGEHLVRRIDAKRAVLTEGAWLLNDVDFWDLTLDDAVTRVPLNFHQVPTSITPAEVIEGVASPETISFWELPAFIESLENSGFSARRHRIFWHAQLATPLLFAAMMLIGAAFSMRHVRFGGLGLMALGGVITGLGYYFIADLSLAFGFSGSAPIVAAAWAPPVSALFLAAALLLHLEDG